MNYIQERLNAYIDEAAARAGDRYYCLRCRVKYTRHPDARPICPVCGKNAVINLSQHIGVPKTRNWWRYEYQPTIEESIALREKSGGS